MIWKRGVARQLEDGRKALTPKMYFNLTQSELGNHYGQWAGTDLQMQDFKKSSFAAVHKHNCKRLRLEVEDQSGKRKKKILVIQQVKDPDSGRKGKYLMNLKVIKK